MAKKSGNVDFVRNELAKMILSYFLIRDCIDGETAVKGMTTSGTSSTISIAGAQYSAMKVNASLAKRYLPQPNATDTSPENQARYESYVERAQFYNVTGRTLDGMTGQVFQRDPVYKIPENLQFMLEDSDGRGIGLVQQSKRAVRTVLPYGRMGILVDFPPTETGVTKGDIDSGKIRPTITLYDPWDIINWDTTVRGARRILSLLVLREYVNVSDDEFQYKQGIQYRVLRLSGNVYSQQLYKQDSKGNYKADQSFVIKDASGKQMEEIPFRFVGSENNDESVDKPPMYDIASLNIGHYRNSADYEESAFICGQPTLALTGLSEDWVKNILKGSVAIGSRAAIPLPQNAGIELLQADPNTMPKDAMEHKERQMVSLGAKLVQQQQVQRTATESIMETSAETSILADVARNVSTAFTWALKQCHAFITTAKVPTDLSFELNTQFELAQMSADDQSKFIAAWQKGAIAYKELRNVLRKAGVATMPDEEAQAESEKELKRLMSIGVIANENPPEPTNPNPTKDPAGHSKKPATRGQ
jgi:hypothetical protein